jgi:hypothetical protein
MKTGSPLILFGKIALGVVVLSAATGVAFAAWVENGDEMFVSMIQAGMAWCM